METSLQREFQSSPNSHLMNLSMEILQSKYPLMQYCSNSGVGPLRGRSEVPGGLGGSEGVRGFQ